MKLIPLTHDKYATVDDEDYDRVMQFKWVIQNHGRANSDYAATRVHGRKSSPVLLHRFILKMTDPSIEIDHRDLNGLNCCKDNLRAATHQENQRNRPKYRCNTSGYKGVFKHPSTSKWRAMITVDGKCVHLGYFVDITDAAKAYDAAALMYFGEFARLNFTPETPLIAVDPV